MKGKHSSSAVPAALPARDATTIQIDASCRLLLLPIVGSLAWLVLSSIFLLIASVKLHSPAILADVSWLSYGRIRPVANDAFVYGFASQAGLAVALWMLCRLGRTALFGGGLVLVASAFWNLGVLLGVLGVLDGNTTGFNWLEFPSASGLILLASYVVFGVCGLLTFRSRKPGEVYPTEWYVLAALFWFPWLFTTARLLLVWFPVRGVTQLVVSLWFTNGLFNLWLTALTTAVLVYFIPKLCRAPLHSRVLVVLAFWSLAIFGGFAGFYRGLPVPAWLVSTGVAATAILLVTMGATVANLWLTLSDSGNAKAPLLGFFKTSLAFYAAVAVGAAFAALVPQLRLTLFGEGLEQLALYGFVAFALFGALHYLVPLLSGATSARFIGVTCWATLIGILVFAGAYLAGGIVQQRNLEDGGKSFLVVMNAMKPFIRISTLGVLVLVIGNTAMLLRVLGLVRECCRNCCAGCDEPAAGAAKLQPARAAR